MCKIELVVGRSAAEITADRRSRQDAEQLVSKCTRTDAVQREVDAVVETVGNRGDVLGCQQAAGKMTRSTRGRGGVEIDVIEEQRQPADAVRYIEDHER